MPDFGGIDFSPLVVLSCHPGPAASCWRASQLDIYATARMTARLIDGKAAAAALRERVAARSPISRATAGRAPGPGHRAGRRGSGKRGLCPLQGQGDARSGDGRASRTSFPPTTSEDELLDLVDQLNADPAVDGILVQLPLPQQIDATRVIAAIDPDKDVDGFHPINAGRLATASTRSCRARRSAALCC